MTDEEKAIAGDAVVLEVSFLAGVEERFISVGESITVLQPFCCDSGVSRILPTSRETVND